MNKEYVIGRIRRRLILSMTSNVQVDFICQKFAELHDLGYLPVRIKTLLEGRRVDMKVPFLTIRNTNKNLKFLTNFLETILSTEMWKSIVNATRAFGYRRVLSKRPLRRQAVMMASCFRHMISPCVGCLALLMRPTRGLLIFPVSTALTLFRPSKLLKNTMRQSLVC